MSRSAKHRIRQNQNYLAIFSISVFSIIYFIYVYWMIFIMALPRDVWIATPYVPLHFQQSTNEALLDRKKLSDQLTLASCPMSVIKNQNWMLFPFCQFGFYLQLSHNGSWMVPALQLSFSFWNNLSKVNGS